MSKKININLSKEEMYQLYVVEKKSARQIADILGCAKKTALRILRKNDIPIRDSSYFNSLIKTGKKVCIKCNEEKDLNDFEKCNKTRDGHNGKCESCNKKYKREYSKKYRQTDRAKELHKERNRKYIKTNKHKETNKKYRESEGGKKASKRASKKYYESNKKELNIISKKYKHLHKKELNEKKRIYDIERRKTDPLFNLKGRIRSIIGKAIRTMGYKKKSKTEEILGCSFEEFKQHIESKWESWMSWENYGKYNCEFNFGWDIDHIVPLSSAKTEEEIIKLCHFSNVQPLCSHINRDIKRNQLNFVNNF